MARRSDHSREELYTLSIAAARKIVMSEGLRGLSSRKIANDIGYAVGTIYNLFKNNDDLIVHLNGHTLDEMYEQVQAHVDASAGPKTNLLNMTGSYLDYAHKNQNLWNLLFEHRLPEGEHLPDWYLSKLQRLNDLVSQIIAPLFAESETRKRQQATAVILCSLHGIGSLAEMNKLSLVTSETTHDLASSFIDNYLEGLAPQRPG